MIRRCHKVGRATLIRRQACWLLLLAWVSSAPAAAMDTPAENSFEALVAEAGLTYRPPGGFTVIEPEVSPLFSYEHAMRHPDVDLELRYAVRPIGRIEIDYEDPHNAAPEPNEIFPLLFSSLIDLLSRGGHSPTRQYPAEQAQQLFNADWAAASVFDVNPSFSQRYSQALLIALHKNHQADVYVIYLYDDYDPVRSIVNDSLSALRFESPPGPAALGY